MHSRRAVAARSTDANETSTGATSGLAAVSRSARFYRFRPPGGSRPDVRPAARTGYRGRMAAHAPRWVAPLPNVLSGIRLALAFAFPFLAAAMRLPVVLLGGISDWLDGTVARRFEVQSTLGGHLDALADKAFVVSAACTLAADGAFSWWQLPLLLARDVVVGFVAAFFALRRQWTAFRDMSARLWGKLATTLVFVFFVVLLIEGLEGFRLVAFLAAAVSSVVAAADYLVRFLRALRPARMDKARDPWKSEPCAVEGADQE